MRFKKGQSVYTSDFWYDLTDGGYIRPEELLEDPKEAEKVNDAIETLRKFRDEARDAGVIEEG